MAGRPERAAVRGEREVSLALAYTQTPRRRAVDRIMIAGPDAHGVATLAARLIVLNARGEEPQPVARFPDTTPRAAAETFARIAEQYEAVRGTEVLDIPVNVQAPAAFIEALAKLPSPVRFYDHHETSIPFIEQMQEKGIVPIITADAVQMSIALQLNSDNKAWELAKIGIVADRDPAILKVETRERIERELLPLANRLDVLVRNPRLVNAGDQAELAGMLAEYGVDMLAQSSVEYPPERLVYDVKVNEVGDVAVLADFTGLDPARTSMWVPKTMEQLALRHHKDIVVAVVPGFNPRTKTVEGYDVRVIKYWLSEYPLTAEELARDVIQRMAPHGKVVGHENYVSIRFSSLEEARRIAREIYRRAEGRVSSTAHLVNDELVAMSVRRDYEKILELLERIAKALERGAEAKEEQVGLLKELYQRDGITRYD